LSGYALRTFGEAAWKGRLYLDPGITGAKGASAHSVPKGLAEESDEGARYPALASE